MEEEYLRAVASNDLEAVKRFLCSNEVNINEPDEDGRTPLVIAIEHGYYGKLCVI